MTTVSPVFTVNATFVFAANAVATAAPPFADTSYVPATSNWTYTVYSIFGSYFFSVVPDCISFLILRLPYCCTYSYLLFTTTAEGVVEIVPVPFSMLTLLYPRPVGSASVTVYFTSSGILEITMVSPAFTVNALSVLAANAVATAAAPLMDTS